MLVNVNFPKWMNAKARIPELVSKSFGITVFGNETEATVTWFHSDWTEHVEEIDNYRGIAGMLAQAFIVRATAQMGLNERAEHEFLFKANTQENRALMESLLQDWITEYENRNGIVLVEELSKFILGSPNHFGNMVIDRKMYSTKEQFTRFVSRNELIKVNIEAGLGNLERL